LRGANGSRECAPDDRLRDEAIQLALRGGWIASRSSYLLRLSPQFSDWVEVVSNDCGRQVMANGLKLFHGAITVMVLDWTEILMRMKDGA
jgi:hypothetical protein